MKTYTICVHYIRNIIYSLKRQYLCENVLLCKSLIKINRIFWQIKLFSYLATLIFWKEVTRNTIFFLAFATKVLWVHENNSCHESSAKGVDISEGVTWTDIITH